MTSPCLDTKHRCRLMKDLQLPMTLQGSKEDLQFIRILPHPSNHFTYLFSVLVPFSYLRVWGVLHHAETWERHLLGGDFCLVFMAPTWLALLEVEPKLFSSVAHIKSSSPVAPLLSSRACQFTLLYTSWRSGPAC